LKGTLQLEDGLPSYQQQLRNARSAKTNIPRELNYETNENDNQRNFQSFPGFVEQQTSNQQDSDLMATERKAWQSSRTEPLTAREKAQFKNKIPFDEDMYEVLKTAIQILSKRIKEEPVDASEAQWFESAIDIIMTDAKKFAPPPKPTHSK
jgi:hypothetical protein